MSIVKLIDDYLVEFGNERFLEGWNGATENIIKLLEDAQVTEAELFDGRIIKVKCESVRADLLIALIKGEVERQKDNESVVFLTERDYDQLSDAIKGEGDNK